MLVCYPSFRVTVIGIAVVVVVVVVVAFLVVGVVIMLAVLAALERGRMHDMLLF